MGGQQSKLQSTTPRVMEHTDDDGGSLPSQRRRRPPPDYFEATFENDRTRLRRSGQLPPVPQRRQLQRKRKHGMTAATGTPKRSNVVGESGGGGEEGGSDTTTDSLLNRSRSMGDLTNPHFLQGVETAISYAATDADQTRYASSSPAAVAASATAAAKIRSKRAEYRAAPPPDEGAPSDEDEDGDGDGDGSSKRAEYRTAPPPDEGAPSDEDEWDGSSAYSPSSAGSAGPSVEGAGSAAAAEEARPRSLVSSPKDGNLGGQDRRPDDGGASPLSGSAMAMRMMKKKRGRRQRRSAAAAGRSGVTGAGEDGGVEEGEEDVVAANGPRRKKQKKRARSDHRSNGSPRSLPMGPGESHTDPAASGASAAAAAAARATAATVAGDGRGSDEASNDSIDGAAASLVSDETAATATGSCCSSSGPSPPPSSSSSDAGGERGLGVLVDCRILKPYGRTLYLGTAVAYQFHVSGPDEFGRWTGSVDLPREECEELADACPVGCYRVRFDDGDVQDFSPTEAYDCALEYHRQRQYRINNTRGPGYRRSILGNDSPQSLPLSALTASKVSKSSGERELRRHANPPLKVGALDAERLAFWTAYIGHNRKKRIAKPEPWLGRADVGWAEGSPSEEEQGMRPVLAQAERAAVAGNVLTTPHEDLESGEGGEGAVNLSESATEETVDGPPENGASSTEGSGRNENGCTHKKSHRADSSKKRASVGEAKGSATKKFADGSFAPASPPRRQKSGLYVRPQGRCPTGKEWDEVRGLWVVPASSLTSSAIDNPSLSSPDLDQAKKLRKPAGKSQAKGRQIVEREEEAQQVSVLGHDNQTSSSDCSRPSTRQVGGQSTHQSLTAHSGNKSDGQVDSLTARVPVAGSKVVDLSLARKPARKPARRTSSARDVVAESSEGEQQAPSTSAPSRKPRGSAKCDGDTHGLPESSSAWLHPQSEIISSSSAPQIYEADRSSVRATYHERLVTVPGDTEGAAEQSFLLSVDTSKIPNAGRGLFLTYLGPDKIWRAPGYVDLGRYGPHRASDIKRDFLMEVKNFVFQDRPGEWSFDGFLGLDKSESMKPLTLFGKNIVQDVIFDITDDATGEVHHLAEETLLPFVNEVTVQAGKGRGRNAKLQQVQNIDAVHHDDGSLHYLLRAGSTFRRGEETELLVYYGQQYEGNRHRKPDAYGGKAEKKNAKKDAAEDAGGSLRHTAILTVDDSEDMSTLSNSDEHASVLTCSHNVITTVCTGCTERTTKVCIKTPVSTSYFTNMRKSIFTYTEPDVVTVLDLFLESPPIDPVARHRMRWMIDQIGPYLKQMLFPRKGLMPPEIRANLQTALELFPRANDSPYHKEDCRVMEYYQYLGVAIRKEIGTNGFKTGMVEQIVESERTGEDDNGQAEKSYLVVYFSGVGKEDLTESEIKSSCIPNSFGMMG